jgi:DNA-binding MarR family transcriptional regulator
VTLTERGRELVDAALPDHVGTEHRLLAGLPARQRDTLASTLRDLLESLHDSTS